MLEWSAVDRIIDAALAEDIGAVDLTSEIVVPDGTRATFVLRTREEIVVAGLPVAEAVFRRRAPGCGFEAGVADGARVAPGAVLATVTGPARALLTAERTALNLLSHMSGIATLTRRYVDRIAGTKAQLIDTRKTTPGLRVLEKHATTLGGARNHRLDLAGGIMIKDNHISVCGGVAAAVARARAAAPVLTKIEVECDRLDQVREALEAGADMLLLDNMTTGMLREAVAIVAGRIPLEASGGVTLETIRAIAETGVDFISVGRITQGAPAVDIGLDATLEPGG
ncbi:carboxylating nicotinate-nucleotide diphosphorylase [Elioraea sp. Yellowstone]|uniref:carboxylating nicotinate-nucleotide diphosphorylase n=1 Tax=Elioraea sp. Yellowstone TaxID=2592070 RepID=UPI00114F845E|nr:carboxylating nicotinate-nucleotide diphosphorylase [Elioraea sp. Yellowstone]TQF78548.1 carboxylating nicotinate-nucleotide diphosphorylase [Elioraea sp. Yellowstone]